jgi:uncharacterized membrane protein YczE
MKDGDSPVSPVEGMPAAIVVGTVITVISSVIAPVIIGSVVTAMIIGPIIMAMVAAIIRLLDLRRV